MDIKGFIFNPLRRLPSYHGDAQAPTLYDYDKDGFISGPSDGRTLYLGEQEAIDQYNDSRRQLNDAQRKALDDLLRGTFPLSWPGNPDDWGRDFDTAQNTGPGWGRDPLILDLDGDGVETTALTRGAYGGVHFNLDAKGLAEQVGWVGQDDGILVRDLNGDGQISSGRELFGNHTLLKSGQEAANGFDALAELDDNGDGVIDSQDAAFASLRVWKDLDADGITDAGELLSLEQAGVHSLGVAYRHSTLTDAQGNQHLQLGGYTTAHHSLQSIAATPKHSSNDTRWKSAA